MSSVGAAAIVFSGAIASAQLPTPEPLNSGGPGVPRYVVDPSWPKPLPGKWILGHVSGVAVGPDDHIWILHRPNSITEREAGAVQKPPLSECCVPAPSVIEFDQAGNVVRAWGGKEYQGKWPATEHTIFVDKTNNVWVSSIGRADQVVLKFSADGQLLLTLGEWDKTGGSNDTTTLGRPAGIDVDEGAHEVYIADGYKNRRVIVFDSETGKFKRYWGAYGKKPDDTALPKYDPDGPPPTGFRADDPAVVAVHAVRIDKDGLVYVCDRGNDRIQVFHKNGEFVKEAFVAKNTLGMGAPWELAFSVDKEQKYLFVPDGTNQKVWILTRADLKVVGSFGRGGRNAGYFGWVHGIAIDSHGVIYTGEVDIYKRVQRFVVAK